jgi:hypothetical protein
MTRYELKGYENEIFERYYLYENYDDHLSIRANTIRIEERNDTQGLDGRSSITTCIDSRERSDAIISARWQRS